MRCTSLWARYPCVNKVSPSLILLMIASYLWEYFPLSTHICGSSLISLSLSLLVSHRCFHSPTSAFLMMLLQSEWFIGIDSSGLSGALFASQCTTTIEQHDFLSNSTPESPTPASWGKPTYTQQSVATSKDSTQRNKSTMNNWYLNWQMMKINWPSH